MMKSFIKNTIVLSLLYLATSCSKDFLNDNLTQASLPLGESNIYISPDWQSADYLFKLPSVKEAEYEIISKPSWLNVGSVNGHITDSVANVQCTVTKNPAFSEAGIYLDIMTVSAAGIQYKIPVGYITEGNPSVKVQNSLTLPYNSYGNPCLPIQNEGSGILLWGIISMPDWLALDTTRLKFEGTYISPYNSYSIPLLFKLDEVPYGIMAGTIVLSTNDKEHPSVSIIVSADLGTPQLNIYSSTIDFSFDESSKTLMLSNYGDGSLIWEFQDIPAWLTIAPSSGICEPYSYIDDIIFTCDRTKLNPGQNSATVVLRSNDSSHPSYEIKVTAFAPGTNENVRAIAGDIKDAVFNKNTNTLYFVTSAPDKLIAYDVTARTVLHEILLSKSPTCFAISEDWTKAAVGHNGFISAIDLTDNTVTAIYSTDYSVYDFAWGENDWFSFTQKGGSFSGLHWINIADGTLYNDPSQYDLDGSSIIKKVPGQPYFIATRNGTSPSGFFAYDVAAKSIKSYAHMDLYNFWFSENGEYIFARNLNIYRTTSATESTNTFNNDINAIGTISTGNVNFYGLQFLYSSDNYLWILQNNSYSSEMQSTSLYQVEDNNFTLVNSYDYFTVYQPDEQTTPFKVSANYAFVNGEGTEIMVLCKGVSNSSWMIQFIPVK